MEPAIQHPDSLFLHAGRCLDACSIGDKLTMTKETARSWREGRLVLRADSPPSDAVEAGRPATPLLVPARELTRRSFHTPEGRAALWHSIAHIEFNAINLAWDAVYRFRDMPIQYYSDWIRVAEEEASHFELIRDHLREMGYDYGDFTAHNGLWEMAQETAHDVMVRMALVPRVLEARGLDVTPGIMKRLATAGDSRAVAILEVIHRDEIGHVEIGTRWFRHCCTQRGLNAEDIFFELINKYLRGTLKGPFHIAARTRAGFSARELQRLEEEAVAS